MPSSADILDNLALISNRNGPYAAAWHVLLATVLVPLLGRRRPTVRLATWLVVALCASVSGFAWRSGNAFNGTVFAALSLACARLALQTSSRDRNTASRRCWPLGVAMIAFGWFYPHFVQVRTALSYLYLAPTGLIPCPTLAIALGFGLLGWLPKPRAWGWILGVAGTFYGLFGVLRLGVVLDVLLLAGALGLLLSTRGQHQAQRSRVANAGATSSEENPMRSSIVDRTQ